MTHQTHRHHTSASIRQRLKALRRLTAIMGVFFFAAFAYAFLSSAQPSQAGSIGVGPWSTSGSQIIDGEGRPVRITGVSWFGFETDLSTPHGLWTRNYKEMIDQITALGYNTINLPFSNDILDATSKPTGINYGVNPELQDLTSLQVLDAIIDYAGQRNLRVILDRQRPTKSGPTALWYTSEVSEEKWIADWEKLAERYRKNYTVIGVDLHNEPHDPACWGCGDTSRDWRLAAEKAGNAILAKNPDLLIFVQGVQTYEGHEYLWGSNLSGVEKSPVRLKYPNKLVYSVHEQPPSTSSQPWFAEAGYPANLSEKWDTHWGFIYKKKLAPVIVSEFGTKLKQENDKQWFDALIQYMGTETNGISWLYWSWNPNSVETGGILLDDWITIDTDKHTKLAPLLFQFENKQK